MVDAPRLILKEVIHIPTENGACRIIVSLSNQGEFYTGEVVTPDREEEQLFATAQATLQAIIKSLYRAIDIRLCCTKQIFLPDINQVLFLVVVEVGSQNSDKQFLPGSCLFTIPTLEIAASATLDALNRVLVKFI